MRRPEPSAWVAASALIVACGGPTTGQSSGGAGGTAGSGQGGLPTAGGTAGGGASNGGTANGGTRTCAACACASSQPSTPCTYEVPLPPPPYIDFSYVDTRVIYRQGGTTDLPLDPAPAFDCANGGQWQYSEYDTYGIPTRIDLCGEACARVQSDPAAIVEILSSCSGDCLTGGCGPRAYANVLERKLVCGLVRARPGPAQR